ncbi:hypothetical protein QJS10_CPA03g02520 [Acorus calamus]|uniref:Uncharacterized protein n=1 Tax=Acorus calamus TaxID=4465 RepID=A0AAV9F868_ACOCL|nr:hypothetical protein QJS10_CPA03g02520 [Acorus calamus]
MEKELLEMFEVVMKGIPLEAEDDKKFFFGFLSFVEFFGDRGPFSSISQRLMDSSKDVFRA